MLKILLWLKKNIWTVVVALVAACGGGVFWSYHRGRVRSLEVQAAVESAHKRVVALDTERKVIEEQKVVNTERIEELEAEKKAIRMEALSLENDVKGMDDEAIEQAFRSLY